MKSCIRCRETKEESDYRSRKTKTGIFVARICKTCDKRTHQLWRTANPRDYTTSYISDLKWRRKNPERYRAIVRRGVRAWFQRLKADPDRYAAFLEKAKLNNREWRARNKEKCSQYSREWRARKKAAKIST